MNKLIQFFILLISIQLYRSELNCSSIEDFQKKILELTEKSDWKQIE